MTIGAKTGKLRMMPLLYIADGENLAVIASRGGSCSHPAWYLNLRARPVMTVPVRGLESEYIARDAEGDERERLCS